MTRGTTLDSGGSGRACGSKTHLGQLRDGVARDHSLTVTRHGKPVARRVPVAGDRKRAQEAARSAERRRH